MGFGAALGILTIFITSVIFIPVIMSFLPKPSRSEVIKEERVGILEKLLALIAKTSFKRRNRAIIIIASLTCMAVGAIGMSKVVIGDTHPGSPFFWQDSIYNKDDHVLNEGFTGTNPYYIFIDSGERYNVADPVLTRDIERLQEILRQRPEVGYVTSYVDVLKRMMCAWHDMNREYLVLPDDFNTGSELLTDFFNGVEPGVTDAYFDLSMRYANIQVFLRDHKSSSILGTIEATNRFVREEQKSKYDIVPAAGLVGLFAAIIEEITDKSMRNIMQVSLVIFLFCAISFRSLVGGLTILLPLAIGKLISFGVMGFGKIGFFLQTIPAIAPGMGIGVDYSIYVLDRLKTELKEHPDDHEAAYVRAMSTSGKAVIFTAMSVACGVLVLLFSELRFQAIMGTVLAVVIFCNMLGALILLPAAVSIWKPRFIYGKATTSEEKAND
jgi:predicted RND superfamily exporter protein